MENAVVQKIRKKITRSKIGEIFFVSSFLQASLCSRMQYIQLLESLIPFI